MKSLYQNFGAPAPALAADLNVPVQSRRQRSEALVGAVGRHLAGDPATAAERGAGREEVTPGAGLGEQAREAY